MTSSPLSPVQRSAEVEIESRPDLDCTDLDSSPPLVKISGYYNGLRKSSEFTIRFEINEISKLSDAGSHSPVKVVANTETSERTGHEKYLAVFLYCNWASERAHWRVDYTAEFVLLNKGVEKMKLNLLGHFPNGLATMGKGFFKFLYFEDLLEKDKSYIDNDKLTIECRVRVEKSAGVRKRVILDFMEPTEGLSNIVLKIGERRINVARDILAAHSPVFATTFYGRFEERNKTEIELYDIVYESVLERVSSYLISTNKFNVITKLKLAGDYRLKQVAYYCISTFINIQIIKDIKNTAEYKSFPDWLRADICEKGVDF